MATGNSKSGSRRTGDSGRRAARIELDHHLDDHIVTLRADVAIQDVNSDGFAALLEVALGVGTVHLVRLTRPDGERIEIRARVVRATPVVNTASGSTGYRTGFTFLDPRTGRVVASPVGSLTA
jgi:hypothetical protein